jgi:hypothetical protein
MTAGRPKRFSLEPFPGEPVPAGLSIAGAVGRTGETLAIRYALSGDLSGLDVAPPAGVAERRDRLWEATCLELFVAEADADGYLEINLSPAGHWNVYRFDGCRRGMRAEAAFAALPFRVLRRPGALALTLALDLSTAFPPGRPWSVAVAAVVRSASGAASHWALAHPGDRPDFHRRDAFLLDLAAPSP